MSNVLSLIGKAWDFYRKQPVLNSIVLWLLFLPMVLVNLAVRLVDLDLPYHFRPMMPEVADQYEPLATWPYDGLITVGPMQLPLFLLLILALSLVMVWGSACVLLVAGRKGKTSFVRVCRDALKYVLPLFLTDILRDCFTILWGLLLIIPGIIYAIRSVFYDIVTVTEGLAYRSALRRSIEVVKGRTWTVFWYLLGLTVFIFLPLGILTGLLQELTALADPRLIFVGDIVGSGLTSIALVLYTLSMVILYGELKEEHRNIDSVQFS